MPLRTEQFDDDADNKQIVCVGEKAHASDQNDAPLLRADMRVVDFCKSRRRKSRCVLHVQPFFRDATFLKRRRRCLRF